MAGYTKMQKGLGDFATSLIMGDRLGDAAAAEMTTNLWRGANARAGAQKNVAQAQLFQNQLAEQQALPGHLAGLSLPNGMGGEALASAMTASGSNVAQLGDFFVDIMNQGRRDTAAQQFSSDPNAAAFMANLGGANVDPQFSQNAAGQTLNLMNGDTAQTDLSRAHMDQLGALAEQAFAGAEENRAQAEKARRAPPGGKLVEVFDPNSPTGTSWVTSADAIGRPGKPGSKGLSLTYDEQGRPIVEMGGRNDLTTAARNNIDTKLIDNGDTLSQITAIRSRFRPEYQQIGTRWDAMKGAIKSKAGLQVGKEERQFLQEFSAYRAESGQMFSNVLKSLSGAAVTPHEMKRAEAWLPNPGTGLWDGDDPITLESKLGRLEDFTRKALAKYNYVRRHGLGVDAVDVDQMPRLMRQRGDEIAAELRQQGVQDATLVQAVKLRLADEFGIGAY